MDYVEIILNGRVFTDASLAEELLHKAGLAKTQKFEYFCDIICHVGKLIDMCGGTAAGRGRTAEWKWLGVGKRDEFSLWSFGRRIYGFNRNRLSCTELCCLE